MNIERPNATITQLILAEIVTAIEKIHKANVVHGDLSLSNILIDSAGHLMLTDFGLSDHFTNNNVTRSDWRALSNICNDIFSYSTRNKNEFDLIEMLDDMTDVQLTGEIENVHIFIFT